MNLNQLIEYLAGKPEFSNNIRLWKKIDAIEPRTVEFPDTKKKSCYTSGPGACYRQRYGNKHNKPDSAVLFNRFTPFLCPFKEPVKKLVKEL